MNESQVDFTSDGHLLVICGILQAIRQLVIKRCFFSYILLSHCICTVSSSVHSKGIHTIKKRQMIDLMLQKYFYPRVELLFKTTFFLQV